LWNVVGSSSSRNGFLVGEVSSTLSEYDHDDASAWLRKELTQKRRTHARRTTVYTISMVAQLHNGLKHGPKSPKCASVFWKIWNFLEILDFF
jgi:hypothetical protein